MPAFAFETTLTTKSYIKLLDEAKKEGYKIVLFYYWLNSQKLAMARVADRVKKGGHNIPKEVVLRRYERSLYNLVNLFIPICNEWYIYDNSETNQSLISEGKNENILKIYNSSAWSEIHGYKK